jgi:hypothetical protein
MENSQNKLGKKKGSKKMAKNSKGSKKMAKNSKGSKKMAKNSKGSKKKAKNSKGSKKKAKNSKGSKKMAKKSKGSNTSKKHHTAFRVKKWAKRGMALESRKILPPPGDDLHLSDYGYSLQKTDKERKASLKKASKGEKSALPVLRRTNLLRNYSKSVPENYLKLSKDVEFLKKEYKKEKQDKRSK